MKSQTQTIFPLFHCLNLYLKWRKHSGRWSAVHMNKWLSDRNDIKRKNCVSKRINQISVVCCTISIKRLSFIICLRPFDSWGWEWKWVSATNNTLTHLQDFVKNDDIRILRDIEQYYTTQIDEITKTVAGLI
jgi:hypothetical protein